MSLFSFQDFIVGLYQSVGMSVGAEFSSEDVSRLYSEVFHVPSNTGEAQTAMKKVTAQANFTVKQHYQSSFIIEQSYVPVSDCPR